MFQLKMVIDMNDFKVSCSISLSMFNLKGELLKKKHTKKAKETATNEPLTTGRSMYWIIYIYMSCCIRVL